MRTLLALTLALGAMVACSATDPFDGEMPAPAPTESSTEDSTPTTLFSDGKANAALPPSAAKKLWSKDRLSPEISELTLPIAASEKLWMPENVNHSVQLAKPSATAIGKKLWSKQLAQPEAVMLAGAAQFRGVPCGSNTCKVDEVCCNESCGICTPPGGACTQEVCGDDK